VLRRALSHAVLAGLGVTFAFPSGLGAAAAGSLEAGAHALEAQRYGEAIERLSAAVHEEPSNARAAELYGRALYEEGELARAVESLERATTLDPTSASAVYWLGRAYGEQAIHGNVMLRAKLAGRIRRAFERAVELDPDNSDARIALLEFYLRAPTFMGGSFDKARALTDDMRRRDPFHAHLAKARLEEHRKRRDLADAEYEAAIREFPGRNEPYFWIERSAIERKDWPAAFEAMDRLLRASPEDAVAQYEIGRIAAMTGRELERGEASLRRYLQHSPSGNEPTRAEAHTRLAEIAERRGDRDAARREYTAALHIDPGVPGARQALGRLR
jgi:tetratricopeptide (TPR) repeat protein